jgi:hypothetical protein
MLVLETCLADAVMRVLMNVSFIPQRNSNHPITSTSPSKSTNSICFRHTDFRRPNKSIDQACLHRFWPANIATELPILRTLHALIETASSGLVANQKRFFKIRLAPVRAIGRLLMLD